MRKFFYVFCSTYILYTPVLAYSQAHTLSTYPVHILMILMDDQSGPTSSSVNSNPVTSINQPPASSNNIQTVPPNQTSSNNIQTVPPNQIQVSKEPNINEVQAVKEKVVMADAPGDPKLSKLKNLIIKESQKAGLLKGIVNGLVILYSSMSDLVLYPVLTTILAILVIGLMLFIVFIIAALKKENFDRMNKLLIFGGFHSILLINLLFILYEQRKITIKFFSFDKDILLVISSAVIGYFIGRYFSRQIFEDKALP